MISPRGKNVQTSTITSIDCIIDIFRFWIYTTDEPIHRCGAEELILCRMKFHLLSFTNAIKDWNFTWVTDSVWMSSYRRNGFTGLRISQRSTNASPPPAIDIPLMLQQFASMSSRLKSTKNQNLETRWQGDPKKSWIMQTFKNKRCRCSSTIPQTHRPIH